MHEALRMCSANQKDIPVTAKEAQTPAKSQSKFKTEKRDMTLEGSNAPDVTAPPRKAQSSALREGMGSVVVTTPARTLGLLRGPQLQPGLGRRRRNHHKRPLVAGGVWPMGEASLQVPGSLTLGKPGFLKSQGQCVHAFLLPACIFHSSTWRTVCCAPNVFIGIRGS